MSTKRCKDCGETKPLQQFYRCPGMADGHYRNCKVCYRRDTKENREAKHEYYLAYDRARALLPHRIAYRKAYRKTDSGKAALLKGNRVYRRNVRTFGAAS